MPVLPSSSLVGRPEPGRGDAGGLRLIGAGRFDDGPIDARAFAFAVPFGAGEGLGLVDGGRKDILSRSWVNQRLLIGKKQGRGRAIWRRRRNICMYVCVSVCVRLCAARSRVWADVESEAICFVAVEVVIDLCGWPAAVDCGRNREREL